MEKTKSKIPYLFLFLMIVFQLLWTGYIFVERKDGCHSDEIWSYGLANSYYQPFVYQRPGVHIDDITPEVVINADTWITGETFRNYITVQEGQRFAYGSVYSNQTLDHHPPLFYMLLHTVCSFFPNQFSFWFGFSLNCVFLILTSIFLFGIGRELTHSDWAALLIPLFYGGTVGASDTFIFVRQYSLLTALCVMFAYFNVKLLSDFNLKKRLVPVLLAAMGAFLTHYYGIVFVGTFTACMCIYMLIKGKIKKMFAYGFSMLGTLGLYFAVYPASLKQMLGRDKLMDDNRPFSFYTQLKIFLSGITDKLFNFEIPVLATGGILRIVVIGAVALLAIGGPLAFLFRNETWFHRFLKWSLQKIKDFGNWLKRANYLPVFGLAASFAVLLVVNSITDISDMGYYAQRYLFVTYPFCCLAAVLAVYTILSRIPKLKKVCGGITAAAAVVCIVVQNVMQPDSVFYFKNYPDGTAEDYSELLKGKNCVCIIDDSSIWHMTYYSEYLYQADNVFIMTLNNLDEDIGRIKERGIPIDYVFTWAIDISEETNALLDEWHARDAAGKQTDSESSSAFSFNTEGLENNMSQTAEKYQKALNAINDEAGYDLVAELNILNGMVYLVKMH